MMKRLKSPLVEF